MGVQGIFNLKFLGPVSFAILIVGLLGSVGQVQAAPPTAVFWDVTGDGDGTSWSDAGNWLDGVKPSGNGETINIFTEDGAITVHLDEFLGGKYILNIGEGVTLIIDIDISLSHGTIGTINNDGTIIIDGTLFNAQGTVINVGTIIINGFLLNADGTFTNDGTIINNGFLTNFVFGVFNNNGLIINNSFLTNSGGVFNNFGQIDNTADGVIDNGFLVAFVSTFNNKPGGIINNDGDVYNDNGSTFNNDGTINNNVGAEIGNGVTVNGGVRSNFNNGGLIENDGLIFNDSTFNNSEGGIINNNDGGVFENFSLVTLANTETLNNFGTINNKEGGFIDNDFGLINNFASGLILNEGIISNKKGIIILNGNGDTIRNFGIIINQCNGLIDGDDPIDEGGVVHNRSCNGILYSIDRSNPPILREIDPTNAKTFSEVDITIPGIDDEDIKGGTGLATNPLTGELFALLKLVPADNEDESPRARTLVTVNPETGVATIIGNTGKSFAGIAFDNSPNSLFGVTGDGDPDDPETLFTISTSDGSATKVCDLGNGKDGETLAFNFNDGFLYHGSGISTAEKIFEKIDSTTTDPCTVTDLPITDFETEEMLALTFGEAENKFFAADRFDEFFTITLSSAVQEGIDELDHTSKGLAFVPFEEPLPIAVGGNGGGPDEPPTIGKTTYGEQVVTCGVKFDSKCFTITAPFHEEFKLYEMMSGKHTISITMFCDNGVNTCNYAAIGIMPYSESMDNTTWKIELYKDFEGNLTIVKTDPEGFLGTVTVTTQIIDDTFWIVSFTVDFKNKDTGPMMFGVQARNDQNAVRNWYLNEGVEIKDSDAYPSIETEFEESLEIDSLCLNEDPDYRYSCAFAKKVQLEIERAEKLLAE